MTPAASAPDLDVDKPHVDFDHPGEVASHQRRLRLGGWFQTPIATHVMPNWIGGRKSSPSSSSSSSPPLSVIPTAVAIGSPDHKARTHIAKPAMASGPPPPQSQIVPVLLDSPYANMQPANDDVDLEMPSAPKPKGPPPQHHLVHSPVGDDDGAANARAPQIDIMAEIDRYTACAQQTGGPDGGTKSCPLPDAATIEAARIEYAKFADFIRRIDAFQELATTDPAADVAKLIRLSEDGPEANSASYISLGIERARAAAALLSLDS